MFNGGAPYFVAYFFVLEYYVKRRWGINLYNLFLKCLTVKYTQVGNTANYATQKSGTTLYIFFEKSNGKQDWKNNLDFPAKPYKRMGKTVWFAHRGFLRVWKDLQPLIAEYVADNAIKQVVIVGYSHGGAIAALCHEYVWYNRPDLRNSLYGFGFGCPRVFWGIKCKNLKIRWQNFLVIKNIDDIVTRLPPAILGYSHVGKMLKIGKRGKYSPIQAHLEHNILTELNNYSNGVVQN